MSLFKDLNFRIILAIVVMAVMGGSIIGPVLPSMIEPLGVSKARIGWVLSIYTLFALIFTPILGMAADRFGRKKILVPSTLLFGAAGTCIAFVNNFVLVLILRGLQGICVAGMMNLAVTLIGDIYEGRQRAKAMGYRTSAQNFINSVMPFAAGALAALSWFYPFFIYTLALPVGIYILIRLDYKEDNNYTGFKNYLKAATNVIKHHKTVWVFFCNFMLFVLLYCIVVYLPMVITERLKLSTVYTGLAITVAAGTAGIFSSQTGRLKGIIKDQYLVIAGFIMAGTALYFISFTSSLLQVFLCLILWGLGYSLIMPTITTAATEQAPVHLRAGVMSVFSMMLYLGQTASPPLFGLILKNSSLSGVFIAAGAAALIPVIYSSIEVFR